MQDCMAISNDCHSQEDLPRQKDRGCNFYYSIRQHMHHFTKSSWNRFPQVGPFKYKKSAKSLKKKREIRNKTVVTTTPGQRHEAEPLKPKMHKPLGTHVTLSNQCGKYPPTDRALNEHPEMWPKFQAQPFDTKWTPYVATVNSGEQLRWFHASIFQTNGSIGCKGPRIKLCK